MPAGRWIVTRPLPDSEAYLHERRRLRNRRLRRVALGALLLMAVIAIVYLSAGGDLPDLPQWLDILLRDGNSEGTGGAA